MLVKFNQYWDVLRNKRSEFDHFLKNEYIPWINRSGKMEIAETYNLLVGEGPYFVAEGTAGSVEDIEALIITDDYRMIKERLFHFVSNYYSKLLVPREEIFPSPVVTKKGYKYIQHFDINPPDYYEFLDFIQKIYLPGFEDRGLKMNGSWYVTIGPTPHRIFEWHTKTLDAIGGLLDSPKSQKLTVKLASMTSDYECMIIEPSEHTQES